MFLWCYFDTFIDLQHFCKIYVIIVKYIDFKTSCTTNLNIHQTLLKPV